MTTELKRLSDTVWKDPATLNLGDSSFKSVFVFTVCPFLEGSTLKKGLVAEHRRQSDLIKSAFNCVVTRRRPENADVHRFCRVKGDVNWFSSRPGTKI